MTDQEILQKAIDKAFENGWKPSFNEDGYIFFNKRLYSENTSPISYLEIIWSHDFAKAFWGTKEEYDSRRDRYFGEWETRLQEMVLEENPIKYLEKFL